MKAVIRLDVPDWQIGQPVTVYFKDTMQKHGVCEADNDISQLIEKAFTAIEQKEHQTLDDYRLWDILTEIKQIQQRNPVIVCPHCGKRVK